MSLYNTHYQHWHGDHLSIGRRRLAIAANGLASCYEVKAARQIGTVCWLACMVGAMALFFVGQLLVADSIIVTWLGNLNPNLQGIARSLTLWLEEHPEISVRTTYGLLFYFFTSQLTTMTFILIAIAIPHLITRDLSSNAIVVYSSKAVNRFDYLLGKFGTVFGMMAATWLAPLLATWLVGNLLSTQWHFFWHSRMALMSTLVFVLSSMVFLSVLALGISAISSNVRTTVGIWVAFWLLGNGLVPLSEITKPWLKFFSVSYDLTQLSRAIFRLQSELQLAQENLPMLGGMLQGGPRRGGPSIFDTPELGGALWALAIMAGISLLILRRRLKPE